MNKIPSGSRARTDSAGNETEGNPAGLANQNAVKAVSATGSGLLDGMRLLVVDDSSSDRMLMLELLSIEGASVTLASSGQAAIDTLRAATEPFDCVLMDIQMPGMDGYEATRNICRDPSIPKLPIVAVTSNGGASDRRAALAAGMNDEVVKPFDIHRLVSVTAFQCQLGRAQAQLAQTRMAPHQGELRHNRVTLRPPAPVRLPETQPLARPAIRRPRVLIVDDEPFIAHTLQQILRADHDHYTVSDGHSAIAYCQVTPPDLVLLDVNMPGMNGLETCRRLKALPETADIPVIFVTAGNQEDDETACWLAGAVDFVTKPVTPLTLRNRVRAHIQIKFHADALRLQRDDILSTLAHEVQQPLNNAATALDAAIAHLAAHIGEPQLALERMQRAGKVLHGVVASIDNTLANSVLLAQRDRLALHDVDIDTLVELACADINPQDRWRIGRSRSTATRTARMHLGLMRLALRNLIVNALAYSPPDSKVVVNVAESEHPLALLLEVRDVGPGLTRQQMSELLERGARGAAVDQPAGHGLGLDIVRRIIEMHAGKIDAHTNGQHGLVMQLSIPQEECV
jgi:CheY-like chemotaxis protein